MKLSLNVPLATLRLMRTRAPGRGGDALLLIKPDPYWLVLYLVLWFRDTTSKALRARILRYPLSPHTW